MSRIAVIGAGAWGTALSIVLARNNRNKSHSVRLWAFEQQIRDSIAASRRNSLFLPDYPIPESVSVADLPACLCDADTVVCAVPSQHLRHILQQMQPDLRPGMLIVSAAKGLEETTLLRMTEVIAETVRAGRNFQPRVGALSGPSFAKEVARGDPTAITIASRDRELAETIQHEFSDPAFRVYTNEDVIGVELGGALKNIIAIAAGVCHGLGLGHNSIAALITRGLAEITRLAVACGGRPETLAGLAGLGDLVLTCTGELSRNRSVGVELGRGSQLPEILVSMHGMVAEGIFTTHAAVELARSRGIEMPISEQMQVILEGKKSPREAIHELMTRSAKSEITLRH
jgi:glycerol-3-phosphate dehydrogenase (NAD(P)+)